MTKETCFLVLFYMKKKFVVQTYFKISAMLFSSACALSKTDLICACSSLLRSIIKKHKPQNLKIQPK